MLPRMPFSDPTENRKDVPPNQPPFGREKGNIDADHMEVAQPCTQVQCLKLEVRLANLFLASRHGTNRGPRGVEQPKLGVPEIRPLAQEEASSSLGQPKLDRSVFSV